MSPNGVTRIPAIISARQFPKQSAKWYDQLSQTKLNWKVLLCVYSSTLNLNNTNVTENGGVCFAVS